jgi:predicted GNAT family acetyltransferase
VSFNQLLVDQPQPEIADSAVVLGEVHVGAGAILAQGLVVRSHGATVSIGNYSAILENGVVIGTPAHPVLVGQRTVFGHRATIVGGHHRRLVRDRQRRDPHAGLASRQRLRDRLVLIHTEVPLELEGRGIGGRLVSAAVDRAVREGLTLVPLCPFARGWLKRHPEAASRAVIDWDR